MPLFPYFLLSDSFVVSVWTCDRFLCINFASCNSYQIHWTLVVFWWHLWILYVCKKWQFSFFLLNSDSFYLFSAVTRISTTMLRERVCVSEWVSVWVCECVTEWLSTFVPFWYQGNSGLIGWVWKRSFLCNFVKWFENGYWCLSKHFVELSCEALWPYTLLFGRV